MAKLSELLKDAGLEDDEIVTTMASFSTNPKVVQALEAGTLRQSDYSRNLDKLAKTEKELKESWEKANAEYVRMQTDFTATKSERDEAARKLEEAEKKLAAAPQIDTAAIQSQLDAKLAQFAAGQTAYFSDVLEILPEHEKMFGAKLNPKELIQQATEAKKTPQEYWLEKYNVPAKREELAAAEKTAYEARIREDERKKVTSEFLNPATRPLAESQKPFYDVAPDAKQPWDDTSPTAAENDLVAALANAGR